MAQQDAICGAFEAIDGGRFREDVWARPEGGGGRTRILQSGRVLEKAGVNVSVVHGTLSAKAAAAMGGGRTLGGGDLEFFAAGLSLVVHPRNPMAPTVHANYRYFERGGASADGAWWFGGGSDLTPAYLFEEDAVHFHATLKAACDRHDRAYYPRFKAWCDEYFYLPHRSEGRGIGGIFFDDLHDGERGALFRFVQDGMKAFLPSYLPILERRASMPYTDAQKEWQEVRRGRYVEFNLLYDRGTLFGLNTGGRVESILMSLPPHVRWEYDHQPPAGGEEERLLGVLRSPVRWV
jgi:coproporphyrinogen III oxidase